MAAGWGGTETSVFAAEVLDEFSEYTKENPPSRGLLHLLETSDSRGLRRTTANVFRGPPISD